MMVILFMKIYSAFEFCSGSETGTQEADGGEVVDTAGLKVNVSNLLLSSRNIAMHKTFYTVNKL